MNENRSDFPQEIILEVTNRCNLACVMCHFHGAGVKRSRPLGDMSREIWIRVLEEIRASKRPVFLMTHGAGEPLLYRDLMDLLARARSIPHVRVGFMTNAMALTREVSEKLLALGIHWLAFSVDGVEPEPHARYRKGSDLKKIEANIDALIQMKEARGLAEPILVFNMVALPEMLPQEEAYVRRWLPHAAQVMVSRYRPIGSRKLDHPGLPSLRRPCPNIFRQLVISWEGKAALCCEDSHCRVEVGDLKRQTIRDIWNGDPLKKIRKAHLEGRLSDIPFCIPCDTWAAGELLEEEHLPGGVVKRETPAQVIYEKGGDLETRNQNIETLNN